MTPCPMCGNTIRPGPTAVFARALALCEPCGDEGRTGADTAHMRGPACPSCDDLRRRLEEAERERDELRSTLAWVADRTAFARDAIQSGRFDASWIAEVGLDAIVKRAEEACRER